ncbi:MAG: RlmI/RlmK family 23S rRNA methyltransferase, partial [bacterium]
MSNKINLEVKLRPGEESRLMGGHLWIFSNELENVDTGVEPGTLCRVLNSKGRKVATGFFNPRSLISVRVLQKGDAPLPEDFLEARLRQAFEYRKTAGVTGSGRMCFGESDSLPGLVVDRYGDLLVVEILSAGMERMKAEIVAALKNLYSPAGIYFMNKHEFRKLEGIPLENESVGDVPESVVIE